MTWWAISNPHSVSEASQAPRVLYYGRRKGKPLTPARQAVFDALLPKLKIEPSAPDVTLDPRTLFPTANEIWLEVGFGAGEHLAAQARANPNIGIIGAEVFLNGVASLVRHVSENNLSNVRIFNEDVRLILPRLPDSSLSRVFALFPDPWPKARHARRRFIGPGNLDQLARLMRNGAELRVASDHPVYIRWALEHLTAHPAFGWKVKGPEDWLTPPPDHVTTRYQVKAGKEGRKPHFLCFFRRARATPDTP